LLWIYTTRARRHFAILRLMWQTLRHTIDTAELLDSWSTPQLTLEPERAAERVAIAIDGELVHLAPPLNFQIKPAALTVIVGEQKTSA
jgi:diacylglycerol kinase family enzyme